MAATATTATATATAANQTSMSNMYHLGYQTGRQLRFLLKWSASDASSTLSLSFRWEALAESLRYGVVELPQRYQKWWMDLVRRDPIHVLVETILLVFLVLVLLWSRSKQKRRKNDSEQLTPREEEELLREWKETGRHKLAEKEEENDDSADRRVVHRVDGPYLYVSDGDFAETDKDAHVRKVLNCATHDFWGMGASATNKPKDASRAALDKYGCGSCGPRGFYGTVDYHLALEARMADVLKTHGSILYSDGASAMTSAIAAFCKRGDVLVVDDAICEPLQTGLRLSRADVRYFRHNNVADLRRVLERVAATDREIRRRESDRKRFLVVEGLYRNVGDVCPLDQVVALKHEFAYRLILDESMSFGTLGPTGMGAMELFGVKPMVDVEIVLLSLEHAVGSIGGICTGSTEVVEHQRLSGAGYCFSASSPPFAAAAAMAALEEMPHVVKKLQSNVQFVYRRLTQRPLPGPWRLLSLLSHASDDSKKSSQTGGYSPILYFGLAANEEADEEKENAMVSRMVEECYDEGLALVLVPSGSALQRARFRFVVTASHSHETLQSALDILDTVGSRILSS